MKRYDIVLLIRHPSLDPAEITAKLGLQPHQSSKAGDPIITPKGTRLPGVHGTGSWNHVFRYEGEPHFSEQINAILDQLVRHKTFFHKIDKSGGSTDLYLQLPGDTNIGDDLPWTVLRKFVDLRIGFSLETFPDMP